MHAFALLFLVFINRISCSESRRSTEHITAYFFYVELPQTMNTRIPPITAILGQACYACFKGETEGISLRNCAKCRSVKYCSVGKLICHFRQASPNNMLYNRMSKRLHSLLSWKAMLIWFTVIKENWKSHKSICKALYELEHDASSKGLFVNLPTTPYRRLQMLDMDIHGVVSSQIRYLEGFLKRDLMIPERNMICWEPRCMGWYRGDVSSI